MDEWVGLKEKDLKGHCWLSGDHPMGEILVYRKSVGNSVGYELVLFKGITVVGGVRIQKT